MSKEIKAFLEDDPRYYQFSDNPQSYWLFTTVHIDGWLYGGKTEKLALQYALNHWLSQELGIHWQRLWAWQAIKGTCEFFYDALDKEHIQAIEKAIAWHEAIRAELDKEKEDGE